MTPKRASHWDDKHATIVELAGTVPARQIAERLGVTPGSLYVYCSTNGISLRCGGPEKAARKPPARRNQCGQNLKQKTEVRGERLALMIGELFDLNLQNKKDPIREAEKFIQKKLDQ